MAQAADYGLGPSVFPRGWFIVAESKELDAGPLGVRFFGQDFALYRGNSGKPVLLDAYCAHMGTHLANSKSCIIVQSGEQVEGDSIRCPYHGWRFGPDGQCNDIPYHKGPIPRSAAIKSYPVEEVMGIIMAWYDPEGGAPEYAAPFLPEWNDPSWVRWELDHLGEINIHAQEIIDNMVDAQHLGPTHGAPCQYFENEIKDQIFIQRQGGWHKTYNCMLTTTTWYTGPGVLLSKQQFGPTLTYELIANTPMEDGKTKVWHACLTKSNGAVVTEEDVVRAKQVQAGALNAFAADFDVWRHKRAATRIIQLPTDGSFSTGRKWYKQFFDTRANAQQYRDAVNGIHHIKDFPIPDAEARKLEIGLFA
jgi:3-ketosteroid 9alpha-monooxygenase subunit A